MPYITLLGQCTGHGPKVVDSNQTPITINGLTINVMGGKIVPHWSHPTHTGIALVNNMQSYVTINGMPIFLIGDSTQCGSVLIPDPQKKKAQQEFIQIS